MVFVAILEMKIAVAAIILIPCAASNLIIPHSSIVIQPIGIAVLMVELVEEAPHIVFQVVAVPPSAQTLHLACKSLTDLHPDDKEQNDQDKCLMFNIFINENCVFE
eukprot:GFUD01050092.1.p2 GENE.GFUD01050092.1~~GFUD01050092.1.p2  ORF type:complete len:106 (+),score=20.45 GFUD01050092.1:306-623(+)